MNSGLLRGALEWVFPTKCPLCGRLADSSPCLNCADEMPLADDWWRSFAEGPLAFRGIVFRYEGRAAQAVRRLKYSRSTSLATWMSAQIRVRFLDVLEDDDLVVPVPIHWSRRFSRGFNQSEILCEQLPPAQVNPRALVRSRPTRPQVGLSREERMLNLAGAFLARPVVAGRRVVLVDDVVTTGGTALSCAAALASAGATEVGILALAGEL